MTPLRPTIKFLLDAGVPVSVGKALEADGHEVIYYHDVLADKAPDLLVAETAIQNAAVLVAIDKDMRQIANRFGKNSRVEKLDLLQLSCNEVLAAKRLQHALPLLESEWNFKLQKSSRRFWFEISSHYMKTMR